MKRPTPPCKGCPDRWAECHAVCEKWAEYEKARTDFYKWRDEATATAHIMADINADRAEVIRKRRKRNKVQ